MPSLSLNHYSIKIYEQPKPSQLHYGIGIFLYCAPRTKKVFFLNRKKIKCHSGNIPYLHIAFGMALGYSAESCILFMEQKYPPSLFWIFVYFLLGYVRYRLGLPCRVRQEVQLGPRRVRAPSRSQNQKKNEKSKIRRGGYLCSKSTT